MASVVFMYLALIIIGAIIGGIIGVCTTTKVQNIMWEDQIDPQIKHITAEIEMEINELLKEENLK